MSMPSLEGVETIMEIPLQFLDRRHEAENVWSFRFKPEQPIDFQAGQHIEYSLPHSMPDERGISRYFTISSAPSEPFILLTTRLNSPGSSFKNRLAELEPGTMVTANDPGGRFTYPDNTVPAVFIAGGIGITPFRSILLQLSTTGMQAGITLLYANRSPDIPFKPLFDQLAQSHPKFNVVYIVSDPTPEWRGAEGRVDRAFIRQHVPELTQSVFYVAGPKPMVTAMRHELAELGVERERIKREGFPGYDRQPVAIASNQPAASHA